jgi:hypothetical protein
MEGLSTITYKNKQIYVIDYSNIGESKEKVLQLLKDAIEEYEKKKLPPRSVLSLTNVTNLHFDSDVISAFKSQREKSAPFEKKVAVIGMKGLQKVAYNFIISFTQKDMVRAFDSELEAKEWLVSD